MVILRLVHRVEGPGQVVELALEGLGARRTATARFRVSMSAQDREDVRWYLEDFLQYPLDPAPLIARRVENRLAALGSELFTGVFEANRDTMRLWAAVAGSLAETRIEVAGGVEGAAAVPWELLRDPATDGVLALRAGAFVRAQPEAAGPSSLPEAGAGALRVLLVICRPGGRADVPFRSVASHLVRLSREARVAFDLDVLRPPTFAQLARVLEQAKAAGSPYQVVHFDGHGAYLDVGAAVGRTLATGFDQNMFSLVSPPQPGAHGYLVFEDPHGSGGQQLVDGPALGRLLVDAGVPVLVLNACRSAHADLATKPETVTAEADAHRRVRAYGSLAQEVMDAGVAGVVAMRYNVYVVTAAKFIGEVYAGLLAGQPLGSAISNARRQLAVDPVRQLGAQALPLQDWMVPVVYEAAPLALRRRAPAGTPELSVSLSQADAGRERVGLDPGIPAGPDVGFYGRDESLLALDRAFDSHPLVLLHAWAGAGKTATALEFARWYALTGAVGALLFTPFTQHVPLTRLLDQVGDRFGPALDRSGVQWATLDEGQRRDIAVQVLAQVPVLWVWDNIEPVAGFPAGTPSLWTPAEQDELVAFLRQLAQETRCKILLTSRRDEQGWLGDLPARVGLPPMPMLERLELARAIAARQTDGTRLFLQVEDWRPLLEFTQGNPLTITILTRQAIRDQRTKQEQVHAFVEELRGGAAQVTDDAAQGRGASLAASLDYGFTHAFTEDQRAILALVSLFQGFVDVKALVFMGDPDIAGEPVEVVADLTRDAGTALLDRAAEVGLLTAHDTDYYAVHPAVPWHLQQLFEDHYGLPGSPSAEQAIRAWTSVIGALASYYLDQYQQGHAEMTSILSLEEANLLRARQFALAHHWHNLIIRTMQGLWVLYEQTGRMIEWRRLVTELIPEFADPATGGPLPGREQQWDSLTAYRVGIARQAHDWPTAQQLQNAVISWHRKQAAAALAAPAGKLDDEQRDDISNLAGALEGLGMILRAQDDPDCMQPYEEAMSLYQMIGDRRGEATLSFNVGNVYFITPGLRDLDKAERSYRRTAELLEGHDARGRARTITALGNVARARFLDGRKAGADHDELLGYVNDAAAAYQQALRLLPADAVDDLSSAHHHLGSLYGDIGDISRALGHYQNAIRYQERQDNRYGAGQTRFNAAVDLLNAGRRHDAMLYARAALRDYEEAGPGASTKAGEARRLIARLEQEAPNVSGTGTG